MTYVPEDPEWDRRISIMKSGDFYCKVCKSNYNPMDNVGQWRCTQEMHDVARNQRVKIRCDHGGPYSEKDDYPIPRIVASHFKGRVLPEAVLPDSITQQSDSQNSYRVFDAIVVRRFDFRAKERASEYWPEVAATNYMRKLPMRMYM